MALHKILMSKDKKNEVFCAKALLSLFSFHNNHNNQYMVHTYLQLYLGERKSSREMVLTWTKHDV